MHKPVQENGCVISEESDVWKLYVFAGGIAGAFDV
jgi:hypothetical protein